MWEIPCEHIQGGGVVDVDWLIFKDALLKQWCKTLAIFSTIKISYKNFWINTRPWRAARVSLINGKHCIYRTVLVILKTSLLCCTACDCHNTSCFSSECWYRNDVLQIFLTGTYLIADWAERNNVENDLCLWRNQHLNIQNKIGNNW